MDKRTRITFTQPSFDEQAAGGIPYWRATYLH
jgi:hypothetical protein